MKLIHAITLLSFINTGCSGKNGRMEGTKAATSIVRNSTPRLGFGYDSLSGTTRGECIDHTAEATHTLPPEQSQVKYRIIVAKSPAQVRGVLQTARIETLHVEDNFPRIGWVNARAASNLKLSQYYRYLLVQTLKQESVTRITSTGIMDDIGRVIAQPGDQKRRLFDICGDEYLSEYSLGGATSLLFAILPETPAQLAQFDRAAAALGESWRDPTTLGADLASFDLSQKVDLNGKLAQSHFL